MLCPACPFSPSPSPPPHEPVRKAPWLGLSRHSVLPSWIHRTATEFCQVRTHKYRWAHSPHSRLSIKWYHSGQSRRWVGICNHHCGQICAIDRSIWTECWIGCHSGRGTASRMLATKRIRMCLPLSIWRTKTRKTAGICGCRAMSMRMMGAPMAGSASQGLLFIGLLFRVRTFWLVC